MELASSKAIVTNGAGQTGPTTGLAAPHFRPQPDRRSTGDVEVKTSTLSDNSILPLVVEPAADHVSVSELSQFIAARQGWFTEMLCRHGGVLFRAFDVQTVAQFQQVSRAVIPELMPYIEGQSPRKKVADNVYTSTEFPAQYRITLHNELSYAKSAPRRIIFFCQTPPATGGETPILDCRALYAAMDPEIRSKFEALGVRYVKNMHGRDRGLGKSWSEHFETDDRATVEEYLRANDIQFEWTADGTLRTWSTRPGTLRHPVTGEMHWFNQANLWHITNVDERHRKQLLVRYGEEHLPTHALFGDGTPIPADMLDRVREAMWDNAVIFPWHEGDVLVLDNYLVAHGRMPFLPPRKILVAMG